MQVIRQTSTELVVHDGRWNIVLMGATLFSMGGGAMWLRWTHPAGWSGNSGPWLVYFVGGAFVLMGILIFWNSADRLYVVDRSARTVSMVVQRLLHRRATLLPFGDIEDVALEKSRGMPDPSSPSNAATTPTWRVVFLLKDGTRAPWTPYSTGDRASQDKCAGAVRAFGGWVGHPAREGPAASDSPGSDSPGSGAPALISHPVARSWGCVAAFLSLFVALGAGIFGVQVFRVATWRPVPASVSSSGIVTVAGDKGNSYQPRVVYLYAYKGQYHWGTSVTPISISASEAWARGLADRFHAGSTVTAYVDPASPGKSYLVRQLSLMPLLFVAVPLVFGVLFAWAVRAQRAQVTLADTPMVPVVDAA
jgi:hypothetical protein